MNLVSLRMTAGSIGAIGLIAACGSGASAGNSFGLHGNAPDATAPVEAGPMMPASSGSNMMAPPANSDSGPATCSATCSADSDCASPCGNGTWCCGNGTCYSPSSGTCEAEGGSDEGGDDSGSAAPAPSM
jgi:hypothetical protein